MKLSVIINTKNAAKTLKQALESIKWVEDIVIVDMHSTDDTVQIAERYTKRIFRFKDVGYADPARNYAISKAKGEWILIVDADEEIPKTLSDFIKTIISNDIDPELQGDVYKIARKNIIFGGWLEHAGWWPDRQIRLFKNDSLTWDERVHSLPQIHGKVVELPATEELAIIHYNYPTLDSYLTRFNRYTTIEVESRGKQPSNARSVIGGFRRELMSRLFGYGGIDGGIRSVGISFMQAMYELTVGMKQWEKAEYKEQKSSPQEAIKELQLLRQDLAYWTANWQVAHTRGLTKLYWMLRRKLKI